MSSSAMARRVALGMLIVALSLLIVGCQRESDTGSGDDSAPDEEYVATQLLYVSGDKLEVGFLEDIAPAGLGEFDSWVNPHAVWGSDASARVAYVESSGRESTLHVLPPLGLPEGATDDEVLLPGGIQLLGWDLSMFAYVHSDSDGRWSVRLFDASTGDEIVVGEGIGEATVGSTIDHLAWVELGEAAQPGLEPPLIVRVRIPGERVDRLVREVETGKAVTLGGMTDSELIYVEHVAGDPWAGDLYSYDIESGATTLIRKSMRLVDVAADGTALAVLYDDENALFGQIAFLRPGDRDNPVVLGESNGNVVAGEFSLDGARAVVASQEGGTAKVRVFEVESAEVVHETAFEPSAVPAEYRLSPAGRALALRVGEGPESGVVERESLRLVDLESGESRVVATVELPDVTNAIYALVVQDSEGRALARPE